MTIAVGQPASKLLLMATIGLTALLPATSPTAPRAAITLSSVALGTEVEESTTQGVATDPSTNNKDQGGKPFRGKAVDKGRRLWEALNLLWVELPLRGPSTGETPIGVDDRGFPLPLKAEQFSRDEHARAFVKG